MMKFDRQQMVTADISLTPVIDMVFLLLIFFLLTSSFMKDQGITIDLPASSSSSTQNKELITVSIAAGGILFIGKHQIPLEGLQKELQKVYASKGTKNVGLKADKSSSIQLLVQVMDAVKQSGALNLSLTTDVQPATLTGP